MTTTTNYKQMINPDLQHTAKLEISLDAYCPLAQLAKPNREMFNQFCLSEGKNRPTYAVESYLAKYEVSPIGAMLGHTIKNLILKQANNNQHKEIVLGGIGQAFLDVCLAVSVADYCIEDIGNPVNYSEYLAVATEAINHCFDNIQPFAQLSKLPIRGDISDSLRNPVEMAKDTEKSRAIALNRVNSAFKILKLWFDGSLKYDVEYEQIVQEIDQCLKNREDELFFAHVVNFKKNQEQFTKDEYDYVEQAFVNRFTQEEIAELVKNIPAETPEISSTMEYFFKRNTRKTTLDQLF